jgi:hypothetical protein
VGVVMMMVVAIMVTAGGECRGGKHHQKQGCSKNLFHAKNVARTPWREKGIPERAPKESRGREQSSFRNRKRPQSETAASLRTRQHQFTGGQLAKLESPSSNADSLTC